MTCLPTYSALLLCSKQDTQVPLSEFVEVTDKQVVCITKTKLTLALIGKKGDTESKQARAAAEQLMDLWESNPQEGPQAYNPMTDLNLKQLDVVDLYKKKEQIIAQMKQIKCFKCPKLGEQYENLDKQLRLKEKIDTIKYALSDANLELMPEFEKRVLVLQKLKYIDNERTVQLKGRVACELNSCDELIVTEMIFENFFTSMTPEEAVAVLSILICESKTEEEPKLTEKLLEYKENITNLALSLGNLQMSMGLDISPTEYRNQLNFGLMEGILLHYS